MFARSTPLILAGVIGFASCSGNPFADDQDRLRVGVQPDGRIVVPTNQVLTPTGKNLMFPGRPVDLAWTGDGQTLVVKNMRDLVFLDPAGGPPLQRLPLPRRAKEEEKPRLSRVGLLGA